MNKIKRKLASHMSHIFGQFFIIYEDYTGEMFSSIIKNVPDIFEPNEETYAYHLNMMFDKRLKNE